MIRTQIKLMFRKKGFATSLIFMFLFCVVNYIFVCALTALQTDDSYICAAQSAFVLCDMNIGVGLLTMIFPIVALLPFSFSLLNDEDLNIPILYESRTSYGRYYAAKAIAAFVGSFAIMFIPCLLDLIQVYFTFPTEGRIISGMGISSVSYSDEVFYLYTDNPVFSGNIPFESLIFSHPFLYDAVYLVLFSLYSGLVGVFGLALSTLFRSKFKILLFLPYIIVNLVINRISAAAGMVSDTDPIGYVIPNAYLFNWPYFFIYISVTVIVSVFLLVRAVRKKVAAGI